MDLSHRLATALSCASQGRVCLAGAEAHALIGQQGRGGEGANFADAKIYAQKKTGQILHNENAVAQACLILENLVHKREKKAAPKVAARAALQKEKKEGNEHSGGAGSTCTGDGAEEEKGKGAAFD